MSPDPIISLQAVSKSFDRGATFAVQNVSLDVRPGGFIALVGASGSGKTTLLKSINRLIQSDGVIYLEGQSTATIDIVQLRRRIGYVFQGVGLFPHMSVGENIAVTPRLLGWNDERITARVAELLKLVDLPEDFALRAPGSPSGGQRQRVGVARALAASPSIVLMDEPFGALDPVTRDALANTYRALHERLGLTSVMVTHDIQEALLIADRIVVMAHGRIVADGKPSDLLTGAHEPLVAAMIEVPRRQAEQVRALAAGGAL